jgi:hypothetical protein
MYTIERSNGDSATANSKASAISTARRMLGVARVYRGAQYQTDRPIGRIGDREYCTGLDIWRSRANAARETNGHADVVITWG